MHVSDPRAQELETGGLGVQSQPQICHSSRSVTGRPCFKIKAMQNEMPAEAGKQDTTLKLLDSFGYSASKCGAHNAS